MLHYQIHYLFKLTKIGFHQVSLRYITVILEEFGAGLQKLEFKHCVEIKLDDIALCQQLKSLRIGPYFTTLLPEKFESRFDSAKFLPQLKIFKSDGCLGRTSRLFEEKSNLVSLVMNCFHGDIELERREPHQKRSKHSAQVRLFINFIVKIVIILLSVHIDQQLFWIEQDPPVMVSTGSSKNQTIYWTLHGGRFRQHSTSPQIEVDYFAPKLV